MHKKQFANSIYVWIINNAVTSDVPVRAEKEL